MHIQKNEPLSKHSAMRLGGNATNFVGVKTLEELVEAVDWAKDYNLEIKVIGRGTNIIWQDSGFNGLVIENDISGFKISPEGIAKIGAGENWDSVVQRTVEAGWNGLECLSAIPGTSGATPVQNVGAYGQEIANVLTEVEAYDQVEKKTVTIAGKDCGFGYRTSRFKTIDKGRYAIVSITLQLTKNQPSPPFYKSLQEYLDENGIHEFSANIIRQAVMAIRAEKLPDPSLVANNGSFFTNPIVEKRKADELTSKFPDLPTWPSGNKVKISAAWLVEQSGFPKDTHDSESGMATWKNQSLVLVNERAKSSADILKLKKKIVDAVSAKFGITLEQEPELI